MTAKNNAMGKVQKSRTDWDRIDAFTDNELTANAESDADNQPLTDVEFSAATILEDGRNGRGKQKSPTKERITIRLSPDVLNYYRSTGKGWQSRIDEALKESISEVTQSQ